MDFECSFQLYPYYKWFDTYKTCDAITIITGNDSNYKAIGISIGKVKILDGVVRILSNVKYVPKSRGSSISLETLDNFNHDFFAEDIMNISKGALIIMKEER